MIPTKVVYSLSEREGVRSFWTRIGTAWVNRDGSITVRLDALPVNGVMQIRDADPQPTKPAAPQADAPEVAQ